MKGKISQATLDDKVHRILRVAVKFGFLDRDQKDNSISLDSPQGRDIALQSAEESIVLLKNENHLLPLETAKVRAIAVIGPNSYPAVPSGGGSAQVDSFAPISLLAGVNNAVSKRTNVTWNAEVIGWHTIFHPQFFRHTPFTTDKEGSQHGLKLEIFAGDNAQGQLQETRTVGYVDNWGQVRFAHRSQIRHFYRWTGYYAASSADAQRFVVGGFGEDSYRLYVDGKLVLEQGEHEGQYPLRRSHAAARPAGPHQIRVFPDDG
jgi:beta-glucosidase